MLGPDKIKYFEKEYAKVSAFDHRDEGATAVREAGRLLEELLREVIRAVLSLVPVAVRKRVIEIENEVGKGHRGISEFALGELIGLWQRCKLARAIEAAIERPTRTLKAIDLSSIRDLRNDCVHNGYTPETHEVVFVLSSLQTFLGFFGVSIENATKQVRSVSDVSELLTEHFSSVEVVEGTVAFYRRLAETVNREEINMYDLTYLVETPPREMAFRGGHDPTREYFDRLRKRVQSGEARLRRIVTFNNASKAAWVLFHLVGAHARLLQENMSLAFFDAKGSQGKRNIMLPNVAMYYSGYDPTNGVAWVYSHQQDDQQSFIGLSGKSLIPTMRRLYLNWFRSCDRLTEERALEQFRAFFGDLSTDEEIRGIAEKYREAILLSDAELEDSIQYWKSALEQHPAPPDNPEKETTDKWDHSGWKSLLGRDIS